MIRFIARRAAYALISLAILSVSIFLLMRVAGDPAVLLAIWLFAGSATLIRIAVLFVLFGIPPWAIDMWVIRIVTPVSVFSHLGGMLVALFIVAKVRMPAGVWPRALAVFLVIQLLSRLFTPPELNVNTAHRIYEIWTRVVSAYWQYWLGSVVVVAASFWLIEFVLRFFFPPAPTRR